MDCTTTMHALDNEGPIIERIDTDSWPVSRKWNRRAVLKCFYCTVFPPSLAVSFPTIISRPLPFSLSVGRVSVHLYCYVSTLLWTNIIKKWSNGLWSDLSSIGWILQIRHKTVRMVIHAATKINMNPHKRHYNYVCLNKIFDEATFLFNLKWNIYILKTSFTGI